MKLSSYTTLLLDDIERRIDPEVEEDYKKQWSSFWEGNVSDKVFTPKRIRTETSGIEIKSVYINDAINDYELMLDSELATVSKRLSEGKGALGIRANYGTGIMTSIFGAEIFEMPKKANTLPTTRSLNDSDKIREILEFGLPDLNVGFGRKVFEFGELCQEIFTKYPKISKYVQIYHPDTQGPLDIAELLWGSEMFYEMYDEPDFVHSVLRLITDTYKSFLGKWYGIVPRYEGLTVHWELMHKGSIMIRLDSAMNISRDFYEEYSKPYDKELFDHFDGGCLHFCGRGDHYVDSLCEIDNMFGINMSQPDLNDMKIVFSAVQNGGKKILKLRNASELTEQYGVKEGVVCA